MKLPRWITCHPAPVNWPPETSPTDDRFVRGSKIVAPFVGPDDGGEGVGAGDGAGVFPPVGLPDDGAPGVAVPSPVTAELPCTLAKCDAPVTGDGESSTVQLPTKTTATSIAE